MLLSRVGTLLIWVKASSHMSAISVWRHRRHMRTYRRQASATASRETKKFFFATVADKKFKMADQDERDARLVVIAKPAINSDVDFMELIREFPTLYNKKAKIFTIKERKKTVGS